METDIGGHEDGAILLSASWFPNMKQRAILDLLKKKKLSKNLTYGLYGNQKDIELVKNQLEKIGYKNIFKITDALQNSSHLHKIEKYEKLVPATWLAKKENINKFNIFEVSWGNPSQEFLNGHVLGAGYINTDLFEEGPLWNKKDDKTLIRNILDLGIDAETKVILYNRDSLAAARVAVILIYAGVKDVRLLDGGWDLWKMNGGGISTGQAKKFLKKNSFGVAFPSQPETMISMPQAIEHLNDPLNSVLVSIRSWQEHKGLTSGYNYISAKGDIPGAVWGHGGTDANHLEDFRNPDNTMRPAEEILEFWSDAGIHKEKRVSFYCGTGWRASEAFFYAMIIGWQKISVFDGGWKEWSEFQKVPAGNK
ncbi:MAG: sulfurtransferase [Bdellovibrionaceae bacterium]|nr:sulfurtransferase [Pseudobdellovibrionaceae bacterium]